jgi:molybdate transport system ATP-binding protein
MTEPSAFLDSRITVHRGAFRLDLPLAIAPGEVVALLGPNGAGKTTALRTLAGLLALTDGHINLAGQPLDQPRQRLFVPAQRRRIGVVFQDYLLFPHLTARDNVAFGPSCHGAGRDQARATADRWLDQVGVAELADRKPRELSGGQAQRVALARALADHPGAALLVTHDPLDALVLADRLVIIEDGTVVQEGDAATITAQPRTDYVARLVGLNLYQGHAAGHTVTLPDGFTLVAAEPLHGNVFVAFPPTAVALHPSQPDGSPRNVWPATVVGLQRHGDNIRIQLGGPITLAADITPGAASQLRLAPGERVWAAIKATETRVYPA